MKIPRLGPGALYLRSLDGMFRSHADLIKVAEVEPQILWTKPTSVGAKAGGSPQERRALAALPQRVVTHGVGYPVGGVICDQEEHIEEFRIWNEELAAPWTSEHLSILQVAGARGPEPCGFLMPPLQTDAGVRLAAQNVAKRAAVLNLPFAFETGVNYFVRREDEMADGEFFAAVAEEADCGILLDLTNLWINEKNGRAKISEVIAQLPLERVWEVHLAGVEMERGYWVDAHSRGVDPELAAIVGEVVGSLPNLGAIIFELAPDRVAGFGPTEILKEMETLHRLWERVPARKNETPSKMTPEIWEQVIAERMLEGSSKIAIRETDEERFALYRHLAGSFRSGAIAELLGNSVRLLLIGIGKDGLCALMDRYVQQTAPVTFPSDEALQFVRWVEANPAPVAGLAEMLKFEGSLIEAAANNTTIRTTFTKDIEMMLGDVGEGRLPGASSDRPEMLLEIGVNPVPFVRVAAGLMEPGRDLSDH